MSAPTELERRLRAFPRPAGATPPQLRGDVSYVLHDTPVGRLLLAVRADGQLLSSSFAPDDAAEEGLLQRLAQRVSPRVLRDPRALDPARVALDDYLAGRSH